MIIYATANIYYVSILIINIMKKIIFLMVLVLTSINANAQIVQNGKIFLESGCYSAEEYPESQNPLSAVEDAEFVYALPQITDCTYSENGDYHIMYKLPNGNYGINSSDTYYEFNSTGFKTYTYNDKPEDWQEITNYGCQYDNAFKLGYKVGYLLADKGNNQYIIVYGKR